MSNRNVHAATRRGFSLIELLVVIGILVVLVGLLVPTVGKVRDSARAADTRAQIASLGALLQAYQGDHNAFPGPLSNMQISADDGGLTAPTLADGGVAGSADFGSGGNPEQDAGKITANENVVLGLLGGLRMVGTAIQYETVWVGTGPGWLGVTPKKIPAYGDTATLSLRTAGTPGAPETTGDYVGTDDPTLTGRDTVIPDIVDRFPDPMPLLIMRARTGQRPTAAGVGTATNNAVVTDGTTATRVGQYDLSQINGYVMGTNATAIGGGKRQDADMYKNTSVGEHGLKTVDPAAEGRNRADGSANPQFKHPYDAHVALRNSSSPNTPKQKDGFIIIGAGVDRVYGTDDDITNFGPY